MFDFTQLDTEIENIITWITKEYRGVRTGRATPMLLDNIQVESYGVRVPINQVANVSVEDARSLRITPYDAGQTKDIEKAITDANVGVGVSSDDSGVRLTFPELTSERRAQLVKIAKDKLEEARQRVRGARDEAWNSIQKMEKDGEIGEDEKFRTKDEMQKKIDEANKKLDELLSKKEAEINE